MGFQEPRSQCKRSKKWLHFGHDACRVSRDGSADGNTQEEPLRRGMGLAGAGESSAEVVVTGSRRSDITQGK